MITFLLFSESDYEDLSSIFHVFKSYYFITVPEDYARFLIW